jgi:hypothetical protein
MYRKLSPLWMCLALSLAACSSLRAPGLNRLKEVRA